MTGTPTPHHDGADGLWRWLLGGLAAGGIVLGLLVAAYALGYHRGQRHTPLTAPAAATTTAPTATAAAPARAPKPAAAGPVAVTPALVARGEALFASDGCAGCHSLAGAAGAGPSLQGAAGRTVELADGRHAVADDAYLVRAIVDPDADVVAGYRPGIMGPAIAGHDLGSHAADVRALVAFLKSRK